MEAIRAAVLLDDASGRESCLFFAIQLLLEDRREDARAFPTTFASEVKGFDLARYLKEPGPFLNCGVNTQFALAATKQALEDLDV